MLAAAARSDQEAEEQELQRQIAQLEADLIVQRQLTEAEDQEEEEEEEQEQEEHEQSDADDDEEETEHDEQALIKTEMYDGQMYDAIPVKREDTAATAATSSDPYMLPS